MKNNNPFLPEGEKIPASGGKYTRFESGENKFRILASAITGWELWVEKKPLRRKTVEEFTNLELSSADIDPFDPNGKRKTPRYFWAFPVYNYTTGVVEILEVSQATIMRGIESFLNDEDYGAEPWKYDFVVVKDAESKPVQYSVRAKPPKELDPEIKKQTDEEIAKIDLTELYRSGDPFNPEQKDDSDEDISF